MTRFSNPTCGPNAMKAVSSAIAINNPRTNPNAAPSSRSKNESPIVRRKRLTIHPSRPPADENGKYHQQKPYQIRYAQGTHVRDEEGAGEPVKPHPQHQRRERPRRAR